MLRMRTALALAALLPFGCRPGRPPLSATDCLALHAWDISRAKRQTLLTGMYARTTVPALRTPRLLRRYCVSPGVVNQQKYGLYFVDDLSHKGPMCVINGSRSLTVVQLGFTAHDTRDSVRKVVARYQSEISPALADSIVNQFK
ncbi:hypothetical protein CDA63_16855 [Hymenobacter amundsenii]|uniref:Uncharacterized protein n=1 Tax=Hymenobacter amundsenii TaxID=2006685 RepID=A0A246FHC2_9BACT|nr:hypothetical protein CDA63_16855 [Hymenobacter amundsenii]